MPLPARLFADDEELGKKDDDHIPGRDADINLEDTIEWIRRWCVAPKRRRRLAALGFVLVVCYLLITQSFSPSSPKLYDGQPASKAAAYETTAAGAQYPGDAPSRPDTPSAAEMHYFDGPLKYYWLGKSLQRATSVRGFRSRNRNVLFAASNIQSLDRLIPMACEMARWNRNLVHMVVMGRHDMSIEEIMEVNGVDKSCDVMWHDARPDYTVYSTDERHAKSVYKTLEHIHSWINSRLLVIEDDEHEDTQFTKSVNQHAQRHGATVVRLPSNAMQTLQWITRLDTGSLSAWHNTYTEILIRAPTGASGSLIRLLRSIEQADYFGVRPPHITLELPSKLDHPTEEFLEHFIWPPPDSKGGMHTSQLTLHRRIPLDHLDPIEASLRYVESFWPSRTRDSHVLLLSPDVQLSPLYYHFLFYNLLEYKHSSFAVGTHDAESLMGISLMAPSTLLDGQTPFSPPAPQRKADKSSPSSLTDYADTTFFQWQAPDTHACLYFGDKWKELHSFFSLRVGFGPQRENLVSPALPAYAEYFLELMRARGWYVLYPGRLDDDLATSHNELYTAPEEFAPVNSDVEVEAESLEEGGDFLYHAGRPTTPPPHAEEELAWTPLHVLLPSSGDLPELASVPMLSYDGEAVTLAVSERKAEKFRNEFTNDVGQCREGALPPMRKGFEAEDLFCVAPSARRRGAEPKEGEREVKIVEIPVDDDGFPLERPASEGRKKAMTEEFEKHLARQRGGASGMEEAVGRGGAGGGAAAVGDAESERKSENPDKLKALHQKTSETSSDTVNEAEGGDDEEATERDARPPLDKEAAERKDTQEKESAKLTESKLEENRVLEKALNGHGI